MTETLESISLIILDLGLIEVMFLIFSCWRVIKAAFYIKTKIMLIPTSSQLCLLADHVTLLNPWALKPCHGISWHYKIPWAHWRLGGMNKDIEARGLLRFHTGFSMWNSSLQLSQHCVQGAVAAYLCNPASKRRTIHILVNILRVSLVLVHASRCLLLPWHCCNLSVSNAGGRVATIADFKT